MTFIYLASPYSHSDIAVMRDRYERACRAAAWIMESDRSSVFAPIAHSHPIAGHMAGETRVDHAFWMSMDLPLLRFASELWVLKLPGWETSRGVAREIEYAKQCGIPIKFIEPETVGV